MLILKASKDFVSYNLIVKKRLRMKEAAIHIFFKRPQNLSFFLVSILIVTFGSPLLHVSPQTAGRITYEFVINDEGSTLVNILYRTGRDEGATWILVPKFSRWINRTLRGSVIEWSLQDSYETTGFLNPFYEALFFSFRSDGEEFEIKIQYNHSLAAMIIEPNGLFFSPQIGFEKGNKAEITVILPKTFIINRDEAVALGSTSTYWPTLVDQDKNMLFFEIPETENLLRVEIGFRTKRELAETVEIRSGIFTFETPTRYVEFARQILEFYNKTYGDLVDLFNVTLENARLLFFLPDFNLLLSIGGYVPFFSERLGDIHINIMYTRAVEGQIEVIALHELVHHFLWKSGISPENLLWFHEGMAEYISIEICSRMGYEGAILLKQQINAGAQQVKMQFGDDLGFLQRWTPRNTPQDVGNYYAAAYYIISRLAEQRGDLNYYKQFFRIVRNERIEDDADLAYYLSLAAGESIADLLNRWGFNVPDLYLYSPLISEAKVLIGNVSRLFEPFRSLAEALFRVAQINAKPETEGRMAIFLILAILIAKLSPILTLITAAALIYFSILWLLKIKDVF